MRAQKFAILKLHLGFEKWTKKMSKIENPNGVLKRPS